MDRVGSSIPFMNQTLNAAMNHSSVQASRAYGPSKLAGPVAAANTAIMRPAAPGTSSVARIGAQPPAAPAPGSDPSRLVAGTVDAIDLNTDVTRIEGAAAPSQGIHALYKHPADKNQAATGVALGRSLDVQG